MPGLGRDTVCPRLLPSWLEESHFAFLDGISTHLHGLHANYASGRYEETASGDPRACRYRSSSHI